MIRHDHRTDALHLLIHRTCYDIQNNTTQIAQAILLT